MKGRRHFRHAVLYLLIFAVLLLTAGCSGTETAAEAPPERAGAAAFKAYYTRKAETDTARDYSRMDLSVLDGMASGTAGTAVDTEELSVNLMGAVVSGNTAEILLRATAKKLDTVLYDNGLETLKNYRFGDETAMLGMISLGRQFYTIDFVYTYSDTDSSLASNQFDLYYRIITPGPFEQDVLTVPLTDFGCYSSYTTFETLYEGNWNIQIPLDAAADESRMISVGKELTAGDYRFTVESVQITPLACTVRTVCAEDEATTAGHMAEIIDACAGGRDAIALMLADGTVLDGSRIDIGSSVTQEYPLEATWILSFFCPMDVKDIRSVSVFDLTVPLNE